ncbi:MAG TPA: WD40 repeat domain-containing protein [Saprospiraceae bacterium]|nr:WD40 repeat domain-containing protein [Saprospiraceae bacterium]HMQ81344.1 WD40 repeat domain-containing protein [Saprospiraceae bacterium]
MNKLILWTLLLCLLANPAALSACYDDLRKEGIGLMNAGRYDEAINRFWAGYTCDDLPRNHDLDELIRQAQERWVNKLEKAVDDAIKAEKVALEAKKEAEKAKEKETIAKQQAEANAVEARRKGKRAESLRLSLLADNVRLKGRYEDALYLSFIGLKLANEEEKEDNWRSFGEAVRDSLAKQAFSSAQPVEKIGFSPEGKFLIVQSDSRLHLIDYENGAQQAIQPDIDYRLSADASAKGSYLVSWSGGNSAQWWNNKGQLMATIAGHSESLYHAVFTPDEQYLLTCGRDNIAKVWRNNGQLLTTLAGHDGNIYGISCSTDGKFLLTRSADGTAKLWNLSGECLATLGQAEWYLHDARFSPNGQQVVTASANGGLKVWSLTGQLLFEYQSNTVPIKEAFFLADNRHVISRTLESCTIWDMDTQQMIAELSHASPIKGASVNPQNQDILTWDQAGLIKLWSVKGQLKKTFTGHTAAITTAAYSPQGDFILTTGQDGFTKLWDTNGNILVDWNLEADDPLPACFASDNHFFAVAAENNSHVVVCPIPSVVFKELSSKQEDLKMRWQQLEKDYNIQFMEDIY